MSENSQIKFCDDIRIRQCNELSFFVNIKDNSVFVMSSNTLHYLLSFIKKNTSERKEYDLKCIDLIKKMEQKGILEVMITNEN